MSTSAEGRDYRSLMKNALVELERLQGQLDAAEAARREPIAIIGLGCRFPGGADTPERYWRLLRDGGSGIVEVPPDRWDVDAWYDPDPDAPGKMYTRFGGFLGPVDGFDPRFFGISPREANSLDPQQRLLLEVTWEALERAGIPPERLYGTQTGTFLGVSNFEHATSLGKVPPARIDAYFGTGGALSVASGRLSFALGLTGPSMTVDTACSSSLVTVHLACQSLRNRECDLALAGGVNVIFAPQVGITFCKARMLAPDGRCKTFDAAADGFVRGEGCGMIVLKRLSDARAAGDPILALIRGSSVNQDGPSGGLTVPSGPSQEAVIRQALARGGLTPQEIDYVEAHGTGTALGDPIEVGALGAVFGPGRTGGPLLIGSAKTNLGHLEGAAGIAGIIKVVLALQHREHPPHLNFKNPSPHIPWERLPVEVPTTPRAWPIREGARRAGVSSFGFSGTNAHVVLEEAPPVEALETAMERPMHVLVLSGRTPQALEQQASRFEAHLDTTDARLADICFTAAAGRSHHAHRLALVASSREQARELLSAFRAGQESTGLSTGQARTTGRPRLAFLFSGQGSQYTGMGRQLYETQPAFRRILDTCAEVVRPHLERPLLDALFAPSGDGALDETGYTQPALFALEYALAQLWREFGVEPSMVMGHSVGEYAAACVAGVFSFEDGLKLICARGRLMQRLPPGGEMIAVMAEEEQVAPLLATHASALSLAARNGPRSVVLSGTQAAIREASAALKAQGISVTPLQVSHAFHSPLMQPMLADFEQAARQVTYAPPTLPLISNVTGGLAGDEVATADYWCRHVLAPVDFAQGMRTLHAEGCGVFVEIGPKATLLGLGRDCVPPDAGTWLPSLRANGQEWQALLDALGRLYVLGAPISWSGFDQDFARRRVTLPTYPWQRQRYWLDGLGEAAPDAAPSVSNVSPARPAGPTLHPLVGARLRSALREIQYEARLSEDAPAYLRYHRVFDQAVVPAAAYLDMALAAGGALLGSSELVLQDVLIQHAMVLPQGTTRAVQTVLSPPEGGSLGFRILSAPEGAQDVEWTLHASGTVRLREAGDALPGVDLPALQAALCDELAPEAYYRTAREHGVDYGPAFQGIERLWRRPHEALARVRFPDGGAPGSEGYVLHPVLLDGCLQVLASAFEDDGRNEPYLPVGFERLRVHRSPGPVLWSHARVRPVLDTGRLTHTVDLTLLSEEGERVATVEGMMLKRVDVRALLGTALTPALAQSLYELTWRPRERRHQPPPDFLPDPQALSERLTPQVDALFAEEDFRVYAEQLRKLEPLSGAYVLQALSRLDVTLRPGEHLTLEALAERAGVTRQYHRLLSRLLDMLTEDGVLRRVGTGWEVITATPMPDARSRVLELQASAHAIKAELTLLDRCGTQLSDVLRGRRDPLSLLFPEDDTTTAAIYTDTPGARAMNTLVQRAIAEAVQALPGGRRLRVLEVGGGTGGTSRHVLPILPAHRTDYRFTDVSPLLVAKAKAQLQEWAFVDYRVLDIEREPAAQGFEPHRHDLIVAANVLHATSDLQRTLEHLRRLLAPGGLLVLLEGTAPVRWLDLTFGLTPGWWRFTDVELRPDHPLLATHRWESLLRQSGFPDVASLAPKLPGGDEPSQQAVVLARAARASTPPREATGPWLILADAQGTGHRLADALRARGASCILVRPADPDLPEEPGVLRVDPALPRDFDRLLEAVRQPGQPPLHRVVHLWSLDVRDARELEASAGERGVTAEETAAVEGAARHGSLGLLHLTQALARRKESTSVWAVTRGAQAVGGPHPVAVTQAPLWGMGRVLALEEPQLWGGLIDLSPASSPQENAETLLGELWEPEDEELIAWREGMRHGARLTRANATAAPALTLHAQATYLITGGLGFLGLRLAQWMVAQGARHLVLVGRGGLPTRERRTDADLPTDLRRRLDAIQALEAAGATVRVEQADVGDATRMGRLIEELGTTLPPLRGVIHAAGVTGEAYRDVQEASAEGLTATLHPKVAGAWVLHRLTRKQPLDFFIAFSSASSIWGSRGQVHYAAANQFLDALAHDRHAQGLPALTVNWGLLAGGGMVDAGFDQWLKQTGLEALTPEQGFTAMAHLVGTGAVQATVARVDWSRFKPLYNVRKQRPLLAELDDAAPVAAPRAEERGSATLRRLRDTPAGERQQLLVGYLQAQVARALMLQPGQLDVEQPLSSLGLDSLMAFELRSRVKSELEIDVALVDFLEAGDVTTLAARVLARLPEAPAPSGAGPAREEPRPAAPALEPAPKDLGQTLAGLNELSDAGVEELLKSLLARQTQESDPTT
ncbi:type I polyketide synthase [Corallococcus sp. Z5C101001]|uniref:type I polyketide synthase n=1 Tax=Corallococcus sp. Z5C101001 TaxID=2596829 RepID=UPI00118040DD|nr:type I polyketide synthase [Corallococcus sp. Z5C101001]TSC24492.1 KR domain-containing protein [Corallococcus sp. Z5C101001]